MNTISPNWKFVAIYQIQDFDYNAMLTKASQELPNKGSSNLPVKMM